MSMGIFLMESVISPVPTCFLNEISASSRMPNKASQGATSPPLVRAEIRLFALLLDFKQCTSGCSSWLLMCPFCFWTFDAFLKQCILLYKKEDHVQRDQFQQRWLLLALNYRLLVLKNPIRRPAWNFNHC